MKPSRFTVVCDGDGGTRLAFSTASGALVRLTPEKAPAVERLLADPSSAATDEERGFVEVLRARRLVVDDGVDELAVLADMHRRRRHAADTLALTIAPTLACNFRCDYCFEHPSTAVMPRTVEEALPAFVERQLRGARGLEHLQVAWFGGEPTLVPDLVERLSERLRAVCDRTGVRMEPAGIVTNGYLLDRAMAERLARCGIAAAQVTLDGPRDLHDARRPLANGAGTYERILDNVAQASAVLQVTVRVNVDARNAAQAGAVVDDLARRGLLARVQPYFAPVTATPGVCNAIGDGCVAPERFAALQAELYRAAAASGHDVEVPLPLPGTACVAAAEHAFSVAPSGKLFKCWEELGDAGAAIGSVFDEAPEPHERANLERYLRWDPLADPTCRDCRLVPACYGGCPRIAVSGPPSCTPFRFNLAAMLRLRCAPPSHDERR